MHKSLLFSTSVHYSGTSAPLCMPCCTLLPYRCNTWCIQLMVSQGLAEDWIYREGLPHKSLLLISGLLLQACFCACHLAALFTVKQGMPDSLNLILLGLERGCLA